MIFSFPLLSGDRETGLATPHTAMISQNIAQVLFGEKNPIGEIVLDDHYGEVKINGVFPEVPANSHLQFDLLIAANIFAWPIAYWAMNSWLQNFAYQIDISIFSFLFAGMLALCIATVTVGVQAIKASFANPVNALRHE